MKHWECCPYRNCARWWPRGRDWCSTNIYTMHVWHQRNSSIYTRYNVSYSVHAKHALYTTHTIHTIHTRHTMHTIHAIHTMHTIHTTHTIQTTHTIHTIHTTSTRIRTNWSTLLLAMYLKAEEGSHLIVVIMIKWIIEMIRIQIEQHGSQSLLSNKNITE